ncbi:MAG: hypothetical protein IJ730_06185 [Alphaproteobacteria bacterium]|nr:hypothetical protein [Alphaproteobacteria bacterium]
MSASSVTIGFQSRESSQTIHKPTVLQAEHKLDIEAENGQLTQAQIKAGIIHAIFTNDLVLKTLADEKWARKKGGGFSFSLGAFVTPIPKEDLGTGVHLLTKAKQVVGFTQLSDALIDAASHASISSIDAGSFEKIIDDFASMVGEEEFYLKVGGILRTESAFVGHETHDPAHEHIEARERQDIKVEERCESYDHSFDLSVGELMTVLGTLKKQFKDEDIADGATQEEAELNAEQETAKIKQDITQEQKNVDETAEKIVKIDEKVKTKKNQKH